MHIKINHLHPPLTKSQEAGRSLSVLRTDHDFFCQNSIQINGINL